MLPSDFPVLCEALASAIAEFRPRVVHAWSDLANVAAGFVSTTLKAPRVILGQRTAPPPYWFPAEEAELYRKAYRALARHPSIAMVSNCAASKRDFEAWAEWPAESSHLVYNGFLPPSVHVRGWFQRRAIRAELGIPRGARVVGVVMRFAPEKDPDLWLETAAAIAARRPNTWFVLAGYGPYHLVRHIHAKASQLGLAERVIIPGVIADVGRIYAALDVLLLTSRTENIPNVMLEAQAAGIPVVGPDVGGIRETMMDGVTGVLATGRTAEELAAAVLGIFDHSLWRWRARKEAPRFVRRRFGHDRMVHETIAVYA